MRIPGTIWLLWPIGLLLALLTGCNSPATPPATLAAVATPTQAASPTLPPPTPTAAPTATPVEANQLVTTETYEGVIFSQKNAADSQVVYEAETYWTPTEADILTLEEKLGPYLEQAAPQDYPGPLKPLSAYKRQYVGFVAEGKSLIFVNFFCETHGVDWQQELIAVEDGGSCYFELNYEPQSGTFSALYIHGES